MIQGKDFHMYIDELLSVVNLPCFEGMTVKIHTLSPMPPTKFATLMDLEVIGDVCPVVPMPKHLVFEAKVWFYVLAKTLIPMLNVHDEYPILAFVQHALMKLVLRNAVDNKKFHAYVAITQDHL